MESTQDEKRMELFFRADRALREFCGNVRRISLVGALYYLSGYTNGEIRIDDALMVIAKLEDDGYNFR